MRLKHSILPAFLLVLVGLGACKTTEKNYREAYEAAREKQAETGGVDSTIYSRLRVQGKPMKVAAGNDTIEVQTVTIGYPKDCGASAETVRRYNVVVGQFKQIFNARAMRQRLIDNGYSEALVVNTREPLYYVVARSCATPEEAAEAMRQIEKDGALSLRAPFPWILRPSHLAR